MTLAFKRMYVDIPAEAHARLKILAVERGMSAKALLAELIEQATSSPGKSTNTRKRRSKKRGKT